MKLKIPAAFDRRQIIGFIGEKPDWLKDSTPGPTFQLTITDVPPSVEAVPLLYWDKDTTITYAELMAKSKPSRLRDIIKALFHDPMPPEGHTANDALK